MSIHTCKHPACSCQIEGEEFCSHHCRQSSKDVARHSTCDCGHPDCGK